MGKTWPLECFADILSLFLSPSLTYSFLYSCNVSLPGLPIAGMREASWKGFLSPSTYNPTLLPTQSLPFLSPTSLLSPLPSLLLSPSLHFPSVSSFHVFFLIMSTPQMLHTINTPWDPVCLPKCFLAVGWKAWSTDSKSWAICYLIGWHAELSVDFSYRGEQGDNGTVSATFGAAGARRRWPVM